MCKGNATISFWNERARGPSPSDKQQVVTEDVLLFPMLSSPQTTKGRFNAWIQHGTNLNDVRLHFSFFFYGLFSSGVTCLQLTPPSARSSLTPTNFKSSFTASIMLLFGLPIGPSGSCYLNLSTLVETRSFPLPKRGVSISFLLHPALLPLFSSVPLSLYHRSTVLAKFAVKVQIDIKIHPISLASFQWVIALRFSWKIAFALSESIL